LTLIKNQKIEESFSLIKDIDFLNEHLFYNKPLPKRFSDPIIERFLSRQIQYGNSIGQFSLTPNDYLEGSILFTGEKLHTKLAIRSITGQEICRHISLFASKNEKTELVLELADKWLTDSCFAEFCSTGECCHSTIGFMRYLNTLKCHNYESILINFIELLAQHRNKKTGWDKFPFYYTLLVLSEINLPEARNELSFALPLCEQNFDKIENVNIHTQRRLDILRKVFSICQYEMTHFITISSLPTQQMFD